MYIDANDKVNLKCDWCGKFSNYNNIRGVNIVRNYKTIQHMCLGCLRRETGTDCKYL